MQRDLVIRARGGDKDAFSQLASAASERLFRTARLVLRDDDQATDAVQDALLSAWLHIRSVRDPDRFDAWLRRLLIRSCYRVATRVGRRRVMEMQVTTVEVPSGDDIQRSSAIRDQLDRGFQRLTVDQRAVLVVHHYLGLPDAEAATVLDVPLGTYKSRLNRSTAAMRAALEADDRTPLRAKESIA